MGASSSVQLGLQPGKQIGSKELDTFWTKFAKGKNKLSKKEMRKFLMQLAKELQIEYTTAKAEELLSNFGSSAITKQDFIELFFSFRTSTDASNIPLSQSLRISISEADEAPSSMLTGPATPPAAVDHSPARVDASGAADDHFPSSSDDEPSQHEPQPSSGSGTGASGTSQAGGTSTSTGGGSGSSSTSSSGRSGLASSSALTKSRRVQHHHLHRDLEDDEVDDTPFDDEYDDADYLYNSDEIPLTDELGVSMAIPLNNCVVLHEDEVFEQMKEDAATTGEIYALSPEESLQVMARLDWVAAALAETDDIPKLREKCGITREHLPARELELTSEQRLKALGNDLECQLCEDDVTPETAYCLSCRHVICRECWQQNIRVRLADYQPSSIACPGHNCKLTLLDSDMHKLATSQQYHRYRSLFVQNYIRVKKNLIYCNNPACDQIIKLRSLCTNDYQVRCECSAVFCFNCCKNKLTESGAGHYPCTCDQFVKWLQKTEDGVFSFRKKPCPKCKAPIIKCGCPPGRSVCDDLDHCPNQACNHMNCPNCSHHFCWICLKDWSGHGDYYNCKFVLPENVRNREVISGYAEVYLKYKDYDGNRKSYLQGRDEVKRKFEQMRSDGKTVRTNNFLLEAVEELAMCYHTLANSYVLYYYNEFDGPDNVCPGVSKELFEYNQRNLESMTGKLSCKYEKEVKPCGNDIPIALIDELMRLTSIVHDYRRKLFAVETE